MSTSSSTAGSDELERLRIEAGTPLAGRDLDERVLPAEAGLTDRAVSFSKGCYPGQEPVARLHYRGHANRALRVLQIEAAELPERDAEIVHEGKTSSVGSRALRAPTAAWSRSGTFGSRFRRPPSSASTGPRLECVLPRARSSGDRAQPCGG